MPKGIFDRTGNPLGWFDEVEKPVGWFSEEFLDDGQAAAGTTPDVFVPRGRAALVAGAIILAAWAAPQLSALKVSAATESNPPVYTPTPADHQVDRNAAWQVKWDAQRSPRIASIIPVSAPAVNDPPPHRDQPNIDAWRVDWPAQARPIRRIVSVDQPPPRRDTPSVEEWRVDWQAQRATQGLPWLYVAAPAVDNPPVRLQTLPAALATWQPAVLSAVKVSTATEDGVWVLPPTGGDNPPPRLAAVPAAVAAWQPKAFGSYSSSVYTLPVSNPPPLVRQDLTKAWPTGWTIPPRAPLYVWPTAVAAVDNPPPRSVPPSVEEWRVDWPAQRAPLFVWPTVVVEQPAHTDYQPLAIARWTVDWSAQARPIRQIVSVDNPQPRVVQPPAIWTEWTIDWQAQRATTGLPWMYVPPVNNDPIPLVVQPTTIREQWQALATWQSPQRGPMVTDGGTWVLPPDVTPPSITSVGHVGKPHRRRHYVEIDGQYFEVRDQQHAVEILTKLHEAAKEAAPVAVKAAAEQAKPAPVPVMRVVKADYRQEFAQQLQEAVALTNAAIAQEYAAAQASFDAWQVETARRILLAQAQQDEDDIETLIALGVL